MNYGFIQASDRLDGDFSEQDEANLLRLATLTATALDALAQLHLPEYRAKMPNGTGVELSSNRGRPPGILSDPLGTMVSCRGERSVRPREPSPREEATPAVEGAGMGAERHGGFAYSREDGR